MKVSLVHLHLDSQVSCVSKGDSQDADMRCMYEAVLGSGR